MNKILLIAAALTCLLGTSCGGDKSTKPQEETTTSPKAKGPLADNELKRNYKAALGGKTFDITISRRPAKDRPTVKDELDQTFYDNVVDVTVTCDAQPYFSKTFTKEAFEDYLSPADRQSTIFMGMAFDEEKSDGRHICLAAQIGKPGTGEGPAFTIEIPTSGSGSTYSILRDTQQDTNAQSAEEAE